MEQSINSARGLASETAIIIACLAICRYIVYYLPWLLELLKILNYSSSYAGSYSFSNEKGCCYFAFVHLAQFY